MQWLLGPILGLLGKIPGVVGTYFEKQADIANANIELQKAIVKAQILEASQMARAQLQYQTAALNATMPLFKQQLFWFLSIPVFITMFMPNYAQVLWANVRLIPEFYWTLYSAVVLTIWGIPIASNIVSGVFNGFTSFAADRRADKIQMESVSSTQYKKALADAMRMTGNGRVSPEVWENVNAALDKLGGTPDKAK